MPQAKKIFSKTLTDTDIKKRLAIPVKILPDLPDFNGSHAVKFHLVYGTRAWPIVCSIRKIGYKKPVFSGGWRNFVISNNFDAGDELTLYKVYDEASASHYRVEVEKPARSTSGDISLPALSLNHDVDDTTGRSARTQVLNFKHQLKAADDAPLKEERGVVMELPDVAAGAPVPLVDHAISKPSCWIFGTNLIDEAAGKAHFKTEQETETKFFGIVKKGIFMGEQLFHSHYITKEEKEIKCAMAYGSSPSLAAGEACYNGSIERPSFDLVQGQATPYAGDQVLNLDLTLAPSIVD